MHNTGCPSRPWPNVSSAYGGVGRDTASAALSSGFWFSRLAPSSCFQYWSYSSQVTSVLPIQNGRMVTGCSGPSSACRPASLAGLPMTNVPPGIGTMSNFTSEPAIFSVYALCAAGAEAGAWSGADPRAGLAGSCQSIASTNSKNRHHPSEYCTNRHICDKLQVDGPRRPQAFNPAIVPDAHTNEYTFLDRVRILSECAACRALADSLWLHRAAHGDPVQDHRVR